MQRLGKVSHAVPYFLFALSGSCPDSVLPQAPRSEHTSEGARPGLTGVERYEKAAVKFKALPTQPELEECQRGTGKQVRG